LDEQPAKASKPNLRLVPQAPPPVTAEGAGAPAQAEMPFAVVEGEPVTELPRDLYIPPYALEVFLVRTFLRRYVTYCAKRRRFAAMNGAAKLYAEVTASVA